MHSQALLATILPLLSSAIARPVVEQRDASTDITITSLSATFPSTGVYGSGDVDSFVTVGVTYPAPNDTTTTTTTTCTVSWPSGTDPAPTEWTDCADAPLQLRLPADGWTSSGNFRVELWEALTSDGTGLDAAHLLQMNPNDPSSENSLLWCQTYGKFRPTQCTLSGPYGQTARTLTISATEESARPN
ncbi:hypothetical protein LQW54_001420 [Pestalotiopsis sp. IQ-011]